MSTPSITPPLTTYAPPSGPIPILYEDAALLAVDKPAGLLCVPGKAPEHADCLEHRLRATDPDIRLVHRIDMDTSGIVIFARTAEAQRHLGLQFERRHLKKRYEALIEGTLAAPEGEIDLPLIADWPRRPLQKVCHETGRAAMTRWTRLSHGPDQSRVALFPETGRSHQLRVHLAALGHPILGDRFYGGGSRTGARLALHATGLDLRHPSGGDWLKLDSPCPF